MKKTKDEVKSMADHIKTNFTSRNPPNLSPGLKREDYSLNWWDKSSWLEVKNKTKAKDLTVDSPIISLYMEDEHGVPIPKETKDTLRGDLYAYWNDVARSGETLYNHSDLGYARIQDFRRTFEGRYPWLRLCYGNWKTDYLWVNYFSSWKKSHATPSPSPAKQMDSGNTAPDTTDTAPTAPNPTNTTAPDPSNIIAAPNASNSPIPHVTKRRLEDNKTPTGSAPKKQKGKEVDIMAPTVFHHSRPQPRKTYQAKPSAKVRILSTMPIRYKLNSLNRIHCILSFHCDRFG